MFLAACSSNVSSGGNPHTAELTADRTVAEVGDSIEFNLQGTGQLLAGIAITYGDGAADTVAAEGAVSAGMRRKHAYSEAGTYVAIGTVVDGTNLGLEVASDSVTVQITDPGGE
jgi:hypothetical protein